MSTVKMLSCTIREAESGIITGEVVYAMNFTETELRLDLGFIATLFVTPSNLLTKATRTAANGMTDATTGYRIELPVTLAALRPGGQATIVKTTPFTIAKNSLFIDLSAAQLIEEQAKSTTFQRPVWSKASAWDQTVAGLDVRLELNLDVSSAPKVESADLRFANRPALGAVTTTARSGVVGGTGGTAFEDTLPPNTLQISRFITFGDTKLTAIQIEWKDTSGQLTKSPVRGATYNPVQTFVFEPGEYITEVSGYHQGVVLTTSGLTTSDKGVRVVDSIEFLTNFKRKFGPVGAARDKSVPYLLTGLKVVGLFGCCGGNVDQLGFISRADVAAAASAAEPPATDTTDDLKGIVTARGDNGSAEGKDKVFNNQSGTKWLDFAPQGSWLQYTYAAGLSGRLTAYTLTSAGDAAERDPADWQLLGSNDDGATWATVDSRVGVTFSERNQKQKFTLSSTAIYKAYRLNITKVANPASANSVQLAQLELLGQQVKIS